MHGQVPPGAREGQRVLPSRHGETTHCLRVKFLFRGTGGFWFCATPGDRQGLSIAMLTPFAIWLFGLGLAHAHV